MDFSETVLVFDLTVGMYCKLNEYMKIGMCLRSRSFFDFGPSLSLSTFLNTFSGNYRWANQSQTSWRSFLGWGNESLFKWSWSHEQDGCQAHIWWKPLKIFFSRTKWPRSLKLGMQHWALEYYKVCSNDYLGWPLTFLCKGQPWFLTRKA